MMNLKLESITIHNFRSIKNIELKLSDFTALVGYNNSGKSNVLEACKWLLRKNSLSKDYFNNTEKEIEVIGLISGITEELLQKIDPGHKSSIEPYIKEGNLKIKRVQNQPFDSVTKIKLMIRDLNIDDEQNKNAWKLNPTGIDNAISALFPEPIEIGAMENVEEDVAKWKTSTTIGKLIVEIMQPIEELYGTNIRKTLEGFKDILDADGKNRAIELQQFDDQINQKVEELFQGIKIKIHIPILK